MEARQKSANLSKYERWINQYAIFVNIYRETARHDAEEHYQRKALISRSLAAVPNKFSGFEQYASGVEEQISNILDTNLSPYLRVNSSMVKLVFINKFLSLL